MISYGIIWEQSRLCYSYKYSSTIHNNCIHVHVHTIHLYTCTCPCLCRISPSHQHAYFPSSFCKASLSKLRKYITKLTTLQINIHVYTCSVLPRTFRVVVEFYMHLVLFIQFIHVLNSVSVAYTVHVYTCMYYLRGG